MKIDLLLRLADLLEADAHNPEGVKFSLDTWAQDAGLEDPNIAFDKSEELAYDADLKVIPVNCNTAACAMGLAAISGAFAAEGLKWKLQPLGDDDKAILIPVINDFEGFQAATVLFDIDNETANQLFSSSHYKASKGQDAELMVATRLRNLVAGTWKPEYPEYDED